MLFSFPGDILFLVRHDGGRRPPYRQACGRGRRRPSGSEPPRQRLSRFAGAEPAADIAGDVTGGNGRFRRGFDCASCGFEFRLALTSTVPCQQQRG
jgi:hypothetical protein